MIATLESPSVLTGLKIIGSAPVGISNRHIHLSREDLAALFGGGYELHALKPLSQRGEFAAEETVTLVGPRGVLECVRILGPIRRQTQVEISMTDGYRIGIKPPVRASGNIEDTPGVAVVGSRGAINLPRGVILAARHIHLNISDARRWQLKNGEKISIKTCGARSQVMENVVVRVKENFKLEVHLDTDEANAALLKNGDQIYLLH